MSTTRIVLIDDHCLFRDGLRAILAAHGLAVVGEASELREAVELVERVAFDLLIVDITLPGSNGLALVRELRRRGVRQPILVLTMHQHVDLIAEAFAAGATGYALKHQSEQEILDAVNKVAARAIYLAPQLPHELLPDAGAPGAPPPRPFDSILSQLSAREREIFDLIVRGMTNAGIAKQLFISIKTVETHRTRIMRKLAVHNVGELIRLAARHGLLAA